MGEYNKATAKKRLARLQAINKRAAKQPKKLFGILETEPWPSLDMGAGVGGLGPFNRETYATSPAKQRERRNYLMLQKDMEGLVGLGSADEIQANLPAAQQRHDYDVLTKTNAGIDPTSAAPGVKPVSPPGPAGDPEALAKEVGVPE